MHEQNKNHPLIQQTVDNPILQVEDLCVSHKHLCIFNKATLGFQKNAITAITGPSGAGKSTFLKCLNRLIDFTPELKVTGNVILNGNNIRHPDTDPDQLRTQVATLFQQPILFPGSIQKNVLFGIKNQPNHKKSDDPSTLEHALKSAALWNEVKDRLNAPATNLSVGQRQRLCLARILAMKPEIILMDEPTSALDPAATTAIENLILTLKGTTTIIFVTHSEPQATRIADHQIHFTVTKDSCCIETR